MMTEGSPPSPVVCIGLATWILQEVNFGDFSVGEEVKFALEFYAPQSLEVAASGPALAEHLGSDTYRVRARVVFRDDRVWVVDGGLFMAYCDHPTPPEDVSVGTWVEGVVHLGVDHYAYFELHHQRAGMRPLMYSWRIRRIEHETTPWVLVTDNCGRPLHVPDGACESFEDVASAGENARSGADHYILHCEMLAGPFPPLAP